VCGSLLVQLPPSSGPNHHPGPSPVFMMVCFPGFAAPFLCFPPRKGRESQWERGRVWPHLENSLMGLGTCSISSWTGEWLSLCFSPLFLLSDFVLYLKVHSSISFPPHLFSFFFGLMIAFSQLIWTFRTIPTLPPPSRFFLPHHSIPTAGSRAPRGGHGHGVALVLRFFRYLSPSWPAC